MRVLYVSPRVCWPLISGAHLRDFYLARQLSRKATLTYIGLDAGAETPRGTVSRDCSGPLGNAEILRIRRNAGYRPANVVRGLLGPTPSTF